MSSVINLVFDERGNDMATIVFYDIINSIEYSLIEEGYNVRRVKEQKSEGYNLLFYSQNNHDWVIQENSVIVNFEQLFDGNVHTPPSYVDRLLSHKVLEPTTSGINFILSKNPKAEVYHLKYGYSYYFENMVDDNQVKDIDVLFIGGFTDRRVRYSEAIRSNFVDKNIVFVCYTSEEDKRKLISRSKIVLNIKAREKGILEYSRLIPLMCQKKFILTEEGEDMINYNHLKGGFDYFQYDNVEMACNMIDYYLNNEDKREFMSNKSYELIKSHKMNIPIKLVFNL